MSPLAPPAVVLPAAKVAAWRLARHRLPVENGGEATEQVARDLVGVQAQVVSAASLAIALRRRDGGVGEVATALAERRLVRSWAMRGTLHLFAADDLPIIVAAIGRREMWHRPKWLEWFGVTEAQLEAAIEMVGEILDDGIPRTRRELSDELVARLGPHTGSLMRSSWGTFLNLATNRGYLCHAATDDGAVRFVRPRRWLGTWREMDSDLAMRTLVERYLAAYGPASLREISRWWGLETQRDLAPILADLGERVTAVGVEGHRGWIRSEDLPAIEATDPSPQAVHLIGAFDPLIVGAGLRDHLLPAAHIKRVSRTAGWISPVVLIGGVAAGIWDHARADRTARITVEAFRPFTKAERNGVAAAAARVGAALGVPTTVAYGPVFPTRSQRPAP